MESWDPCWGVLDGLTGKGVFIVNKSLVRFLENTRKRNKCHTHLGLSMVYCFFNTSNLYRRIMLSTHRKCVANCAAIPDLQLVRALLSLPTAPFFPAFYNQCNQRALEQNPVLWCCQGTSYASGGNAGPAEPADQW